MAIIGISEEKPDGGEIHVGKRLRELRAAQKLSIRALAEMSALNFNTLSLIENGKTSPSVSTLQQLATALQVNISAFFETSQGNEQAVYQKAGAHPRAAFAHGFIEDLGAGMSRLVAEPLIVTLAPHADSGETPIVHTGREFVYCLEGQILYTVGSESYQLEPGDSLLFEAYLPHRWENSGDAPSRNLLVLCPLDERDHPKERHFHE